MHNLEGLSAILDAKETAIFKYYFLVNIIVIL
jgi:hypothetical protein